MNNEMFGFVELERFLPSDDVKPHIVANTERGLLNLTKYSFDEGALLRFQQKISLVSSNLISSNGPYEVAISEKTELDVRYFILDKNGYFVEDCCNARKIIHNLTGAKIDSQNALFDGVSGQRTYRVSTNRIEYMDAINLLDEN